MHIGLDARLADYTAGGIAQYIRCLAAWLPRLAPGARFTLYRARRRSQPWAAPGHVRQRTLLTPPHHRWEHVLLPLELASERLDLLHGPDFLVPRRRRCPAVITIHDLAFVRYPAILTPDSRRHYAQVARVAPTVERVICDSAHTAADVEALLGVPRERLRVVHLAPTVAARPDTATLAAVRARYALPPRYFLYLGTLEPRKNLPTLLRALARLPAPVPLLLAGPRGWLDEPVLAAAARLGERVRWLGPVPAADLPALYAGATAFVFPSLYEGFGLPPLEAMALGTPVVAARTSSLPEVLGDAALFVPPLDETAWTEALQQILDDAPLRAALRARGQAQAARYSWERTARATLAVYREALAA
ncbi:MAG TPA: glycosyltransferase family 1 protein [Chloroflexota bacterium]|nr:glycosyltransferase family 1 protein [Chloroflexota bacterium]